MTPQPLKPETNADKIDSEIEPVVAPILKHWE